MSARAKLRLVPPALLAIALVAAGCSQDSSVTPRGADVGLIASGDIAAAGPDFTITIEATGSTDAPLPGPFVLHGRNLTSVPGTPNVSVDLSVENAGSSTYPEPVVLTFVNLLPDSVRVLDADNGVEGPGARIVFSFANDDARWAPGEESLPRTVTFASPGGGPLAFHARIDIGPAWTSGRIGGVVWNDANRNGVMDGAESGLTGVNVLLTAGEDGPGVLRSVMTGADGTYVFEKLPAGFYTVRAQPMPPAEPTTPAAMYVLLTVLDGGVSSFEHADFGFALGDTTGGLDLLPVADTTVRADLDARLNDNYGCDPYVAVGRGRGGQPDRIRGLVRFELPLFFREQHLVRATLVGQVARFRDGTGQSYELAVNAVVPTDSLTPWIEGNGSEFVDGNHAGCAWVDPADGVAWVGAGDGGDANNQTQPDFAREPAAVTTVHQDIMAPVNMARWDVTDLVRGWYDGSIPNLGVFIRDVSAPGEFRSLWFASREGEEAGMGRALRLVLEFADVPPVR